MTDSEPAILAAIKEVHEIIRENHREFRIELATVYANLARSDEVQDVKDSIATLAAALSNTQTRAECDACRANLVDKRTFIGTAGGLAFLGGIVTTWDKIRSLF